MRTRALIGVALAALAGASSASAAQTITLVNHAHVGARQVQTFERAMRWEAWQLRAAWGTASIRFGAGGWQVVLVTGREAKLGAGWHSTDSTLTPDAQIDVGAGDWTSSAAHEIVEMLVNGLQDRFLGRWQLEVVDPVSRVARIVYRGVALADFVTRGWFTGARGRYDLAGVVKRAGDLSWGYEYLRDHRIVFGWRERVQRQRGGAGRASGSG